MLFARRADQNFPLASELVGTAIIAERAISIRLKATIGTSEWHR